MLKAGFLCLAVLLLTSWHFSSCLPSGRERREAQEWDNTEVQKSIDKIDKILNEMAIYSSVLSRPRWMVWLWVAGGGLGCGGLGIGGSWVDGGGLMDGCLEGFLKKRK